MNNHQPLISIGLPVYNGEKHIQETLDSLTRQSFKNFEIVICDNASTDKTEEICRKYVEKDPRIKYHQNSTNLGPAKNYNLVFERSQGKYFKWASYDDLYRPNYLEKCVDILEKDDSIVLCYPLVSFIDADSQEIGKSATNLLNLKSMSPAKRFKNYQRLIFPRAFARPKNKIEFSQLDRSNDISPIQKPAQKHPGGDRWTPIFGIIRSSALEKTPKIGSYVNADVVLLGELALLGRYHELPEHLFLYRDHTAASGRTNKGYYEWSVWFDPENKGKLIFPLWQQLFQFIAAIMRSRLSLPDKVACYNTMLKWLIGMRARLLKEIAIVLSKSLKVDEFFVSKFNKQIPKQW